MTAPGRRPIKRRVQEGIADDDPIPEILGVRNGKSFHSDESERLHRTSESVVVKEGLGNWHFSKGCAQEAGCSIAVRRK